MPARLDCLLIGYYEPPFEEYERLIRRFGERSEPYRDLRMSMVDLAGGKTDYVGLLNRAYAAARQTEPGAGQKPTFVSGEIPSLAASYLCAFLRRRGWSADYVNLPVYERADLDRHLAANPVCVAITTTFYLFNQPVVELIKLIRGRNPDVRIVVGGPLIANHFRQLSQVRVLGQTARDPLSRALLEKIYKPFG